MPFDFPSNPPVGTVISGPNGVQYRWTGTAWVATPLPALYAPLNSPVFTGDPQAPTAPVGDADQSLANTQFVARSVAPAFNDVGRNFLHNSIYSIWQRGAGAFTGNVYTADRWFGNAGGGDILSIAQSVLSDAARGQIGDEGAIYALQNSFTGVAAGTNYVQQAIEGVRRLSSKTVTVSFWAIAGTAGLKLGANLYQTFGTGGSPSPSVTVLPLGNVATLTTAWMRYSFTATMPSVAGKTVGTNGNDTSILRFYFSAGASAPGDYPASGNLGAQSGAIALWGVQLEIGSQATPLEKPDPQQDLAKCMRFYTALYALTWGGYQVAGSLIYAPVSLPVVMRATPTASFTGTGNSNASGIQLNNANNSAVALQASAVATGPVWAQTHLFLSADL